MQARFAHLSTIMSRMHHRRRGYPFGSLVDFATDNCGRMNLYIFWVFSVNMHSALLTVTNLNIYQALSASIPFHIQQVFGSFYNFILVIRIPCPKRQQMIAISQES